jgi:FKBP-type peptidyl-prolyl cis-trans isomerase SlyD
MKIEKGRVVDLDYSLHFGDGEIVDRSEPGEPLSYLHGEGEIVPGLESALEGLGQGDARQVVVAPAQGYGEHDPSQVQKVPRSAFPPGFEPSVGMELTAQDQGGDEVPFTIREVGLDEVTIDLNHPLAGKSLHFDVKVLQVRAATPEELEHGHAHGPEGHEDGEHEHGEHGHEH